MNRDSDELRGDAAGAGHPGARPRQSFLPIVTRSVLLGASACLLFFLCLAGPSSTAENDAQTSYTPRLFEEVAAFLEDHYLDTDRIAPRELLRKTFASLENSVDEILVENSDPEKPYLAVNVDTTVQMFNLNEISDSSEDLVAAMKTLEGLFRFLEANYKGETPLADIQYAVLNGFLGGLDPHTLVFSPEAFREFFVHIEGEIYGVGMYVGAREGKLQVIEVLKGTPAFRAKLKKNDIIARIGDESTINMTVQEAVERIRGPRGSEITLTVKRKSPDDENQLVSLAIAVERNRVVIKSVESKLITDWDPDGKSPWKGGVGYVIVQNFDKNTNISLRENLSRLTEENGGPLAGLVLDLRGNSGGLLTQAVEMCDFFLTEGSIVSTATRATVDRRTPARNDGREPDYPIVALANSASASGAEIVVGALQKNGRAILVGTPTFGKGSVQQLHRLSNEAQLKITVSEYLLPGNISIQENGVVPDVLAQPVTFSEYLLPEGAEKGAGEFDLFADDRHPKERDYKTHIVSRFAKKEKPLHTLRYLLASPDDDEDESEEEESDAFISGDLRPEKDKLVQTALHLLRHAKKPFRKDDVLGEGSPVLADLKRELFAEIVEKLHEKGVNWEEGPPQATTRDAAKLELKLSHSFTEVPSPDKDDVLPVPQLVLTARLTNKGAHPVYRAKGISRSDYFIYDSRELLFGKVAPGETVEASVRMRVPYYPRARNDLVTIDVSLDGEEALLTESTEILLAERARPRFSYNAELRHAGRDKPITHLAAGDKAVLRVTFQNTGEGTAHKGIAILRNEGGRQVFLTVGRVEFESLAPGDEKQIDFEFEIRPGKPVEAYEFELAIVDSYSGEAVSRGLTIGHGESGVPFSNGESFSQPRITARVVDPESKETVLVTSKSELRVESTIRSDTASTLKAWIVATLLDSGERAPPDKIVFMDSKGKDRLSLASRVPLRKGVNLVTVFAKDQNDLESRRSLVIRRD